MSTVTIFGLHFTPDGGFPWDNLLKILRGGQWMGMLQNGIEILSKFSTG